MKNPNALLLSILFTLPNTSPAGGDGVLLTLEIQAASIIIFFMALLFIPVKYGGKMLLFFVYALTVFFVLYSIKDVPYLADPTWTNTKVILLPLITVALTYLAIRRWLAKKVKPEVVKKEVKEEQSED